MANIIVYFWIFIKHKTLMLIFTLELVAKLLWRSLTHDFSKISPKEIRFFLNSNYRLDKYKFGTEEYIEKVKNLKNPHYSNNRHHPEYFGTIDKMNLVDVIEMYLDW